MNRMIVAVLSIVSCLLTTHHVVASTRPDASYSWMPKRMLGIMTVATYARIDRIGGLSQTGKALTDSDVSWAIGLLSSAPPRDTLWNRRSLHTFALSVVACCKHLTNKQEDVIYHAALRLVTHGDPYDKSTGVISLGLLHDPRARPILRRVVVSASPSSRLRKYALQALALCSRQRAMHAK